jgi:RNA polymerase sigma factor (sigma-70 family)
LINELIIQGCLQKDRRSERLLYEASYDLMMKIACRYFKNEDEVVDVVNRSFLKVLSNLEDIRDIRTYYGWAKQITVRSAIDAVRAKKSYNENYKLVVDDEHYSERLTQTQAVDMGAKDDVNRIFTIMRQLPDVIREVVNMVIVDGFTHKEVSDALGISENNSRQLLSRGRAILQDQLIKQELYHKTAKA